MNSRVVDRRSFIRFLLREDVPLTVVTCGMSILPKQWGQRFFTRRSLVGHLLWGMEKGELLVCQGNKETVIPTGATMRLHGHPDVWFRLPEECEHVRVYFFRFRLGGEEELVLERSFSITRDIPFMPSRFSLLNELARKTVPDQLSNLQLRVRLADLLVDLDDEADSDDSAMVSKGGLTKQQQRRCMEFIQSNISRFFSLSELADYCRLNPVYLSAKFRRTYGKPPQMYIKSTRIQEAKTLLLESNLSITDIADSLGYRDIYFFSRQFKEETRLSPSVWREKKV